MTTNALYTSLLLLFLVGFSSYANCLGDVREKTLLHVNGVDYLEIDISEKNKAFLKTYDFPLLRKHRTWLESIFPVKQSFLLRRQRNFYKVFGEVETDKYDAVIHGAHGKIDTINCLQAYLMDRHLSLRGDYRTRSEFGAFVLLSGQKMKVLFSSSSSLSVSYSKVQKNRLAELLSIGWILFSHIHNHPFFVDNKFGDIAGTVMPSHPDFKFYQREYHENGLRYGQVTNGFDTLTLEYRDFLQTVFQRSYLDK